MATKKFLELQDMSDADLTSELDAIRTQYQKMKFDHAIKGLDNPISIREVRRDVARIETEIRRREVASFDDMQVAKRSKIRHRRRKR
jgi:large subunit ribosomal protein L29